MEQTFRDIIKGWPGGGAQMSRDLGVKRATVSMWQTRGRIPWQNWQRLVEAGRQYAFGWTMDNIFEIAVRSTREEKRVKSRDKKP